MLSPPRSSRHGARGRRSGSRCHDAVRRTDTATLDIDGGVTFIIERPDGLLIGGVQDDQAWISKIGESGEVWRKHPQPCGDTPVWFGWARRVGDELWAVAQVDPDGAGQITIVRLDLEGEVLGVSRIAALDPSATGRLISDGDTVVMSGRILDGPDAGKGWLARLR